MGNLYDSFTQCVAAKQAGTFTEDMIDYPTIDAGIQGSEVRGGLSGEQREGQCVGNPVRPHTDG